MTDHERLGNGEEYEWEEPDQEQFRELAERARVRHEHHEQEVSEYVRETLSELSEDLSSQDSVLDEEEELEYDQEIVDVALNVGRIAAGLGLKNHRLIDEERIHKLEKDYWYDIPLRDRILEIWDDELGFLYPPTIEDLEEEEGITEDIIFRRAHEGTVKATEFLDSAGVDRMELLEWGMTGTEQQKHAMRCLTWVLRRQFMEGYVEELRKRVEQLQRPLAFKSVIQEIVMESGDEIKKQFTNFYIREITLPEDPDKPIVAADLKRHITFDPLRENWSRRTKKAYEIVERELKVALAVCEQVFVPDLTAGRYDAPTEQK